MNWSTVAYHCPNEDPGAPLATRKYECFHHQDMEKLFDDDLVANWIECKTCGYEVKQVWLNLPKSVEVLRHTRK